jgi:hypothetical protein
LRRGALQRLGPDWKDIVGIRYFSICTYLCAAALGSVLAGFLARRAEAQFTPAEASEIRAVLGARIEALTILGGDYGQSGGDFRSTGKLNAGGVSGNSNASLAVTKLGGEGDLGETRPLGDSGVGWQAHLGGNMGWIKATNNLNAVPLTGDVSTFDVYAIEFGGGARLWLSDKFSLAPTVMGLYGHTSNSYTANSAFMMKHLAQAEQLGLVNWGLDTWTFRPGVDLQYLVLWDRTIVTLSSDPTYFHTESFKASNAAVFVNGDSGSWANTIDIDFPMGVTPFGHELRTGGYIKSTNLFGGLKRGLNTDHLNEIHGRLVLDYLNQLWMVQWLGLGASYIWGQNGITGWTAGIELAILF